METDTDFGPYGQSYSLLGFFNALSSRNMNDCSLMSCKDEASVKV